MNKISFPSDSVQLLASDGKTMAQDWARFLQDLHRITGSSKEPVYADVFFSSTSMLRDDESPPSLGEHNGVKMYSFPDGSVTTAYIAALVPQNCAEKSPIEMVFKCISSGSGAYVWRVRGQIDDGTFDKTLTMSSSSGISTGSVTVGSASADSVISLAVERVGTSTSDTFSGPVLLVGTALKFQCIGVGGL